MKSNLAVLKYGGSSVSNFDKIKDIAAYLKTRVNEQEKLVVVVSAMGDTTDILLNNINELNKNPEDEHVAMLLSTGEQQSVSYLAMALADLGIKAKPLTGAQATIATTEHTMKSRIASIDGDYLKGLLNDNDVLIVAGFQGMNEHRQITTLGRGGSDTTATALAAVLGCHCEIYTDVAGIFSIDPRIYPEAKKIDMISYEEMMEMSFLGANIIETRSIKIAINNSVPLYIAKALSKEKGTWIVSEKKLLEKNIATGIAVDDEVIQVDINHPGYSAELVTDVFCLLEENDISIDLISQIEDEGKNHYNFTTKSEDKNRLTKCAIALQGKYPDIQISLNEEYVKVSIIGAGMMEAPGVISKIYKTIINNHMRIYQISTSGISISCLVDKADGETIARLLSKEFDL